MTSTSLEFEERWINFTTEAKSLLIVRPKYTSGMWGSHVRPPFFTGCVLRCYQPIKLVERSFNTCHKGTFPVRTFVWLVVLQMCSSWWHEFRILLIIRCYLTWPELTSLSVLSWRSPLPDLKGFVLTVSTLSLSRFYSLHILTLPR